MAKHRTHSIAFKRQVVQEYLAGETVNGGENMYRRGGVKLHQGLRR